MNYTKTLRNYCLQNNGKLFDAGFMAKKYFHMIPYKSYLKILNRLQDENILTLVSKGVYLIGEGDVDEAIRRNYMGDCKGMTVGRQMLYEQGIKRDKKQENNDNVDFLFCANIAEILYLSKKKKKPTFCNSTKCRLFCAGARDGT